MVENKNNLGFGKNLGCREGGVDFKIIWGVGKVESKTIFKNRFLRSRKATPP